MSWFDTTKWLAMLIFAREKQERHEIKLLAQSNAPKKRSRPDKRTRELKRLKKYVEDYREENKKRKQNYYGKKP